MVRIRNRNKSRQSKKATATYTPEVESAEQVASGFQSTLGIIRPAGYALLIFFLMDLADTLSPLDLMNPVWEFQTIGTLVEQVPIPLIALVMIFFGGKNRRGRVELLLVRVLSVMVLLAGVIYLLFIPVAILDAVRIDKQNQSEINSQVQQQLERLQPVKAQLEQANTEQELQALLNNVATQGEAPIIENRQQYKDVKDEINSTIASMETTLRDRAQTIQKNRRRTLLKNSVKWNIGALISGILFIGLWQATDWTRRN
jgi:ABC-type multidrug transport system fused ATPase/permease subunit